MNGARISKAAVLGSVLMATYASALGLGEAELKSWLGQSLNATVALTDTQELSPDDILVRQIYGQSAQKLNLQDAIDNPRYLISTETDAQSNIWVNVSTRNPINEPYVSFVLQVEMPGGSVSREYTLLIDMPPSGVSDSNNYARKHKSNYKSNDKSTATTEPHYSTDSHSNTYTVLKGDTLGQVAQSIRPDESIRLKAIIQNLYDRNLSSFESGDINQLIQGAALKLPSPAEYAAMPKRRRVTQPTQKIRRSASQKPPKALEQHLYSTYSVKSGDTLSQVADVIRPSKRIPLHAATQTLIDHNIDTVGDFGGRLSIGQQLRIPADKVFYLEANLPPSEGKQSAIQPQIAANIAKPKERKTAGVVPAGSNSSPLEQDTDTEPLERDNRRQEDSPPLARNQLLNDSQQLQSALQTINGQVRELQDPELLLKIDQLMALQKEQVAMTRRLINAQPIVNTKDSLAVIETKTAIESAPIHLYGLIALLSCMVAGLSARLYWPPSPNRDGHTAAIPEDKKRSAGSIKDTTAHDKDVEQSLTTEHQKEHLEKDSLEPATEFDLDLDDALIPDTPVYTPNTTELECKFTRGESAESEQHDKDQKLHQKLAERNLEASNTRAFDNNFIDSAPINLDEIFQPGDDDSITALSNSHRHVENDVESDVIWQANIYSAYGQHSRAENLLNEGLHTSPESIALKLALLDIYARSEQHEQFERLCAAIPQDDPSVRESIQQWREEFNIPPDSDSAQV